MKRRDFLSLTLLSGTYGALASSPFLHLAHAATKNPQIKAICFDAFPIFDPRSIFATVKSTFPEHENFAKDWFGKIFAYSWLRTSGEKYADFLTVIENALDYTLTSYNLEISPAEKQSLLNAWMALKIWPDVPKALDLMQTHGIKMAFLSNMTEDMLRRNARNSGVEPLFDYFSTDRVQAFKPDPKAYQMSVELLGLPKQNIAFCAFAGWDAAGADWFGYPTIWINRLGQNEEFLSAKKLMQSNSLDKLTDFVLSTQPRER